MVDTPGFVEGTEHISIDNVVAHKADVAKKLVIVDFAVSQTFFLIVASSQERFFALGTYKMLNMPSLAKGMHNPFLNGAPTGSTDWYSHLVMATQAVEFRLFLSRLSVQFHTTRVAIEVVGMVCLSTKLDVTVELNQVMALVADVLASPSSLLFGITFTAQCSS